MNKAHGSDEISNKLTKCANEVTIAWFKSLSNIVYVKYPKHWRNATIAPI